MAGPIQMYYVQHNHNACVTGCLKEFSVYNEVSSAYIENNADAVLIDEENTMD